ncbi:hypothetical protein BDN72DRAFT_158765 [Pluteus cervinus]|uniref:Uncharacterized protein n=1 Tax=Pluteus cervinus TaxID=181527 RepID=A0ACD3AKX4_9AGAR|nr:hypothetical protein BDN72DRAFT_158765 [Pluteus cervinus]
MVFRSGHRIFFRVIFVILPLLVLVVSETATQHCDPPRQDDELVILPGQDGGGGTFVALGVDNVMKLREYMTRCPSARPSHLMLSDATIADMARNSTFPDVRWSHLDLDLGDDARTSAEAQKNSTDQSQFAEAVNGILRDSSTMLQSLVYLAYIPSDQQRTDLLNHTYPHLSALTTRPGSIEPIQRLSTSTPNLTHLHIVARRDVPRLSELLENIPHVSRLRFTGATDRYHGLPMGPIYQLEWSHVTWKSLPPLNKMVPSGVTVIIQPGFNPMLGDDAGWCGTPGIEYDAIFEWAAEDKTALVGMPIKEDYEQYNHVFATYPLNRAKEDFLEWIGGMDGAWRTPKEFTHQDWWWRQLLAWDGGAEHEAQEL